MDKFWERYIQSRPAPGESKGAFEAFAAAHRDPGPRITAQEPRIGLFEAGLVTRGENANQWRVNNFYSKTKEGKFQPPKGKSSDAFFNSEKEALAAIEKRKKESSHGLSLEELNKKLNRHI